MWDVLFKSGHRMWNEKKSGVSEFDHQNNDPIHKPKQDNGKISSKMLQGIKQ